MPPAYLALAAAALFGASTPAAKVLIGQIDPQMLAGLLYLGSGLGLSLVAAVFNARTPNNRGAKLNRSDWSWLTAAILTGGIVAPLLLMMGLRTTAAGSASLLLNTEAVFTAVLAWLVFKENFDRRIFFGMVSIVAGSIMLAWQPAADFSVSPDSLFVIGACFCWALDNNFTRNISDADPVQIAAIKGLVAGFVNVVIALCLGNNIPNAMPVIEAAAVGFLGYGVSLVLFIKALRHLGSARTGAYVSTAPFAGSILSLLFLHEAITVTCVIAAGLMAFGVWLHLTETHEHEHSHSEEDHEHLHSHDEHHQHEHEPGIDAVEPHTHWHQHKAILHSHPHYPDSQHRHEH